MKAQGLQLHDLLSQWQRWAETANQGEDGWQSCFPAWLALMTAASEVMACSELTCEDFQMVEQCWLISEEDEDMADNAKANLSTCWNTILRLYFSRYPEVRWQAYEVLGNAGDRALAPLTEALHDENPYCRRRAILSLIRLSPPDAQEIAAMFINDSDAYLRQAAQELMMVGKNPRP